MRLAVLLVWALMALAVVLPFLGRRRLPRVAGGGRPDELVKDPVCQTYVVRSRAVRRAGDDGPRLFCSAECARRYAGG